MAIEKQNRASSSDAAIDWRLGKGIHNNSRVAIRRGVVEYNRDPEHRGRCRVRVAEDGTEMSDREKGRVRFPTGGLFWCQPLFSLGAGMGFGAFTVPIVGSRVWVMYEKGNPDMAVYFGGWYSNTAEKKRYGVTHSSLNPPLKRDEKIPGYAEDARHGGPYAHPPKPTEYQGHWDEEQGPELPLEVREMFDHTPETQMFFKTLRGASMMVKEMEEHEALIINDRLGSQISFEAPTDRIENGVLRRGRQTAALHEPMRLEKIFGRGHRTRFWNFTGAGMEMLSSNPDVDDSWYRIQQHEENTDVDVNRELMPTNMNIEMDEGEDRFRIRWTVEDEIHGEITWDNLGKELRIKGLKRVVITGNEEIEIVAPKIRLLGDVDIEGEIRHLGGKKITFLDNDNEPYGSQARNFWTHKDTSPPPYDDKTAAVQLNERRSW